jgi:hypothetical protein
MPNSPNWSKDIEEQTEATLMETLNQAVVDASVNSIDTAVSAL